jgi:hypothetical protein
MTIGRIPNASVAMFLALDAPERNPQQNEWNQQEAPPCYPKYPVATAGHRAKHSRKTDTVACVGMITRIHLCNVSIHLKPRQRPNYCFAAKWRQAGYSQRITRFVAAPHRRPNHKVPGAMPRGVHRALQQLIDKLTIPFPCRPPLW